jgi:hypothetical protein
MRLLSNKYTLVDPKYVDIVKFKRAFVEDAKENVFRSLFPIMSYIHRTKWISVEGYISALLLTVGTEDVVYTKMRIGGGNPNGG